jgi:hypothetical protein
VLLWNRSYKNPAWENGPKWSGFSMARSGAQEGAAAGAFPGKGEAKGSSAADKRTDRTAATAAFETNAIEGTSDADPAPSPYIR